MLGKYLTAVREKKPVIHSITNYVTVNDTANIILACGASPIMADAPEEAEEIAAAADALYLNIGTLNSMTVRSMLTAGKKASEMGKPVVFDPVGAGAGRYRTDTAFMLMKELNISVIRGNISEIRAVASQFFSGYTTEFRTRGVDADAADSVTESNAEQHAVWLRRLSGMTGAVIAVTGSLDLVSDSSRSFIIRNGRSEMSRITGTGCQLTGLIAAFAAASPDRILEASAAAVCVMGSAGETGWNRMKPGDGNASYRNRIIDAVYNMDGNTLDRMENFYIL